MSLSSGKVLSLAVSLSTLHVVPVQCHEYEYSPHCNEYDHEYNRGHIYSPNHTKFYICTNWSFKKCEYSFEYKSVLTCMSTHKWAKAWIWVHTLYKSVIWTPIHLVSCNYHHIKLNLPQPFSFVFLSSAQVVDKAVKRFTNWDYQGSHYMPLSTLPLFFANLKIDSYCIKQQASSVDRRSLSGLGLLLSATKSIHSVPVVPRPSHPKSPYLPPPHPQPYPQELKNFCFMFTPPSKTVFPLIVNTSVCIMVQLIYFSEMLCYKVSSS